MIRSEEIAEMFAALDGRDQLAETIERRLREAASAQGPGVPRSPRQVRGEPARAGSRDRREASMIGLISCAATKLDRPAPARHLYTSELFRRSLRYTEARCEHVYVLSALHHLVELDQVVAPYDQRIGGRELDRRRWARVVTDQLEERHGRELELLVLAGVFGLYAAAGIIGLANLIATGRAGGSEDK